MSVSAAGLLKQLQDHSLRYFTTADVITLTGLTGGAATGQRALQAAGRR